MEVLGPLFDFLKTRPEYFITAFLLVCWWLERTERKDQQKVNFELQGKQFEQADETKGALSEIKMLLQILTRGRH